MQPAISIVIPTYGRDGVLRDMVASLLALIDRADELLVIDQTPEHAEETTERLAGWDRAGDIRWIQHQPPGVVGAMNRGLREAKGDIVLFLDDDIVPDANLVAAHRQTYVAHPEAWAVVGRVLQPEDRTQRDEPQKAQKDTEKEDLGLALKPPASNSRNSHNVRLKHSILCILRFPFCSKSFLRKDLDFRFNGSTPAWVENVMAGNLSVRREKALSLGGFDENFSPPVSYRFETEFAKRIIKAGGKIRFEPAASIRHLRAARGGTRSRGSHMASASPLHGVGDYYYALKHGRGWERIRYMVRRPFREVCTKYHLRHPWWIPVKYVGELRAMWMALKLNRGSINSEAG